MAQERSSAARFLYEWLRPSIRCASGWAGWFANPSNPKHCRDLAANTVNHAPQRPTLYEWLRPCRPDCVRWGSLSSRKRLLAMTASPFLRFWSISSTMSPMARLRAVVVSQVAT